MKTMWTSEATKISSTGAFISQIICLLKLFIPTISAYVCFSMATPPSIHNQHSNRLRPLHQRPLLMMGSLPVLYSAQPEFITWSDNCSETICHADYFARRKSIFELERPQPLQKIANHAHSPPEIVNYASCTLRSITTSSRPLPTRNKADQQTPQSQVGLQCSRLRKIK